MPPETSSARIESPSPSGANAWSWVWAIVSYLIIYGVLLAVMRLRQAVGLDEALFALAIYGVAFSLIAWWSTRGLAPREVSVKQPAAETALVLVYFLFLVVFVTFGFTAVRSLAASPAGQHYAIIVTKLAVFVLLPFLLLRALYGYRLTDFVDLHNGLRGHWRPLVVVGVALVLFQLVVGRAHHDLPEIHPRTGELALGFVLAWGTATLEAGLVEEWFFRVLLLERLAVRLRSPGPALVITSLLFGLMHAPGLYLRPEVTLESLSEHSLLVAVGYSVVMLSIAGFLFGVLWLRTRNLLLVALLHGLNDAVPALAGTIEWLRA